MASKALRRISCLSLLFISISVSVPNPSRGQTTTRTGEGAQDHPVQVSMKNIMYHFTDRVAAHIVQLQGQLLPTRPGALVAFDDRNSFTLSLASAEIAISCSSLAQVLNENVFSSSGAPIKDITVESKNNQMLIKGKLHQKGDVPFETIGTLSLEGDGRIRLHTEHLKAAHLPVKGLLDLLGIDISRMINTKKVQGVSADKDDLILNPEEILPPPRIKGKVSAVRVQGNDIIQIFGSPEASNFASKQPGNYMAYHDGTLRFGKLTMEDADLILIDMDPSDTFDFYLDHYKEQLVAGYTKITMDLGLRVYARDYNKLRKRPSPSRPTN
jgi:hypothetical protein